MLEAESLNNMLGAGGVKCLIKTVLNIVSDIFLFFQGYMDEEARLALLQIAQMRQECVC